jgi:hypothetical protein
MTNILFDIMYTIMMTTTLSIIGFYGARFTLAVTLYIFDKLLRLIAISNSSDELPLPLPPPGVDELLIDLMAEYRRLLLSLFFMIMFPFLYYCIGDEHVGTTIIITINIALLVVYYLSSRRSASSSPLLSSSLSLLPCDEQQRRSTTPKKHQSSRMMIMHNILFENIFIILWKPTFLKSYFVLAFMKMSIVEMVELLRMDECTTSTMRYRYRSTSTSKMHVLLLSSSSWLLSDLAFLLYVNNFLMIMHFVIMSLTDYE